jgi:hypothetical protein
MSSLKHRTSAPKKSVVHFLQTYKFGQGQQDPVIDRIKTCMDDTGFDAGKLSRTSGVSYGAIKNWLDGTTRFPRHATAAAAVRAMGFDFALVHAKDKLNGKALDASVPGIIAGKFRLSA